VISKKVAGRAVMSTLPSEEQLPLIEQQLAERRRFWSLAEEFAEISDELSRKRLANETAEAKATAKKGASRAPLNPISLRRSKC